MVTKTNIKQKTIHTHLGPDCCLYLHGMLNKSSLMPFKSHDVFCLGKSRGASPWAMLWKLWATDAWLLYILFPYKIMLMWAARVKPCHPQTQIPRASVCIWLKAGTLQHKQKMNILGRCTVMCIHMYLHECVQFFYLLLT